jgi:tetratricopeptide (TPR) repeat protein
MQDASVLHEAAYKGSSRVWLEDNAAHLYQDIQKRLRKKDAVEPIIDALLVVYPHLLDRGDLRDWAKLMKEAHKRYTPSNGAALPRVLQIYTAPEREIPVRIQTGRRRRRERVHPYEMLQIYIQLLMDQTWRRPELFSEDRVNRTFEFARSINDPYLYNKLYQMLALIFVHRGEGQRALDCAQITYPYWSRQQDASEMAQTEYAMAHGYQDLGATDWALLYFNRAARNFDAVRQRLPRALVLDDSGLLHLRLGAIEAAINCFQQALTLLDSADVPAETAAVLHHLAMAQAGNGMYTDALINVQSALDRYADLKDRAHYVRALVTRAFVEAQTGEMEDAHASLGESVSLWKDLPGADADTELALVRQFQQALDDGASVEHFAPGRPVERRSAAD